MCRVKVGAASGHVLPHEAARGTSQGRAGGSCREGIWLTRQKRPPTVTARGQPRTGTVLPTLNSTGWGRRDPTEWTPHCSKHLPVCTSQAEAEVEAALRKLQVKEADLQAEVDGGNSGTHVLRELAETRSSIVDTEKYAPSSARATEAEAGTEVATGGSAR